MASDDEDGDALTPSSSPPPSMSEAPPSPGATLSSANVPGRPDSEVEGFVDSVPVSPGLEDISGAYDSDSSTGLLGVVGPFFVLGLGDAPASLVSSTAGPELDGVGNGDGSGVGTPHLFRPITVIPEL